MSTYWQETLIYQEVITEVFRCISEVGGVQILQQLWYMFYCR